MGNKEAKFKAIFEAIDTSGNKKVDEFELLNFLNPHQNPKVKEVFTELSNVEIEEFWKVAKQMEKNDLDGDRNYTFEEFYQVWHYWLWSFKSRDTKLERFLSKNQHTQSKLLNFENWTNEEPQ